MREMGASLIEFENEGIHYLRGQGLSAKGLTKDLEAG
jgi:hypothetical protein